MTERLPPPPAATELPEPVADELLELPAGTHWARLFFHAGRHPQRWDDFRRVALPANPGRFDAFGASDVDGVAYLALAQPADRLPHHGEASALATCVAEHAQPHQVLDRLDERTFAVAVLTEPMTLLDVSSDWATRARAGSHLSTAPKALTSQWAQAIATRWPDLHGVAYRSSVRPAGRAVAAWAPRATHVIHSSQLVQHRRLDDPVLRDGALSWAARVTGTLLLDDAS